MPVISAFADHPTHPYVRVQINWADTPSVTHAAVYRYNTVTGECVPLRPYICYDGWELLLSCGHGTFWDTEVPFDQPVYYITTSSQAPCVPAAVALSDEFFRDVVNGWGSADTGQAYTLSGGTNPDDYDVTYSGGGTQNLTTVNTRRHAFVSTVGLTDQNIYGGYSLPVASATGAGITMWLLGRLTDVNNWYSARTELSTAGVVTLILCKRVAGVVTDIGSSVVVGSGQPADSLWTIRLNVTGSQLRAKAWLASDTEPATWQLTATDTDLPTGPGVGTASRLETGSGNAPLLAAWHRLLVGDPCAPCTPVSIDTSLDPITVANTGVFWLSDPTRPCNDRPVPLCPTGAPVLPECGGPSGILFVGMGPEIYQANSHMLQPMNRHRPLSAVRPRGDATSSLRLQTMTFTDRNDLIALNFPGTQLMWRGPAEFGIPDRYIAVQPLQISPELSDLRIQVRAATMPYVTQERAAGPTQGICGARVADICELYPTWNDLAATGMTWDDLVRGVASPVSANPDRRTWDDVQAEFVDWDAVEAGGRTWDGVLEGD